MPNLKVPSLQHLARNWHSEAAHVSKVLVRLATNPPIFNYNPLNAAARDLLVLKAPYEQVAEGIRRMKRADVRDNLLEVLPLIRDHFEDVRPDFFQDVERRYYSVGRGLRVPFDPPMIYGVGGQLYFPWFSFWRSNPLANQRLSLFVTLVDEMLLQDPDLEYAQFQILDFSIPKKSKERALAVVEANLIPRLSEAEKTEMLEIFVEGYEQAQAELRSQPAGAADTDEARKGDPDQLGLFD